MIEIICENLNDKQKKYPKGIFLMEIAKDLKPQLNYPILGALVNNKVRDLNFQIFKHKKINFFDITHPDGYAIYQRSLYFLLYKATTGLFPDSKLIIKHSISGGKFCEILNLPCELNEDIVNQIKYRMQEIVSKDIPFIREELLTEKAIEIFEKNKLFEKTLLFKTRNSVYTSVYNLDNSVNYYYGYLVPSTSYLEKFRIEKYYNGILLQPPSMENPDKFPQIVKYEKLFNVFQEHKNWINILDVPYVGDLNTAVENKQATHLIKVSEALHEKKLSLIADQIHSNKNIKIILISGPSSSGKTTFSKKLDVHLSVLGHKTIQMSTDDYFVERENTPRDEFGNYDFECLETLDLELFNDHLAKLLAGEEIEVPKFDFAMGKKFFEERKMQLDKDSILIIEGIHTLNPKLTSAIDKKYKFKIFVSALTQISIDSQNPIPTTDNRLIRRMVRDYKYRGYSALETLRRWQSVRRGEQKYVFPFQEDVDVMFNSALLCELGVLKVFADPILNEVPKNQPEYSEAVRLLKFLSYFKVIPESEIPPTSILREFFGGSSFIY